MCYIYIYTSHRGSKYASARNDENFVGIGIEFEFKYL